MDGTSIAYKLTACWLPTTACVCQHAWISKYKHQKLIGHTLNSFMHFVCLRARDMRILWCFPWFTVLLLRALLHVLRIPKLVRNRQSSRFSSLQSCRYTTNKTFRHSLSTQKFFHTDRVVIRDELCTRHTHTITHTTHQMFWYGISPDWGAISCRQENRLIMS